PWGVDTGERPMAGERDALRDWHRLFGMLLTDVERQRPAGPVVRRAPGGGLSHAVHDGGFPAPVRQGALHEAHAAGARGSAPGAASRGTPGGPVRGGTPGGPVRGADSAVSGSVVRGTPRRATHPAAEDVNGMSGQDRPTR